MMDIREKYIGHGLSWTIQGAYINISTLRTSLSFV